MSDRRDDRERAGDALGKGKARPSHTYGKDDGAFDKMPDGTIGGVARKAEEARDEQRREPRRQGDDTRRDENRRGTLAPPKTGTANSATFPAGGNDARSGGINTSDARGRNSDVPGAVGNGMGGGSRETSSEAGGLGSGNLHGGFVGNVDSGSTSADAASGESRDSNIASSGGVAVSGGRGDDLGGDTQTTAGDVEGYSGGTTRGRRESDLGGGLSGGMRSGEGKQDNGALGNDIPSDLKRRMRDAENE